MIKINLLPTKRKPPRKVTELQKQLIIGVVVLGGVTTAMVLYFISLNGKIASRKQELAAAQAEVARQEQMLREVRNVEEERKKVTDKIAIIEQLKKNQQGPVRLLDEISRAIPVSVDIITMVENNGNVSISGEAFTNEDVVKFIDHLKASPYFADVFLQETAQVTVEGYDIYKYKLQFKYKGL
ncbi:MAG: PilN domain-containing protein [Nitrospirota bacterium]